MSDKKSHPDPDLPLEDRLERLRDKLDHAAPKAKSGKLAEKEERDNARQRAGVAQAFRLSSEFIAGVVVGGGIGYAIDAFFGTSPWGLIVFFLLGFATAILNVLRAAGMVAESEMRLKPAHDMQNGPQNSETGNNFEK